MHPSIIHHESPEFCFTFAQKSMMVRLRNPSFRVAKRRLRLLGLRAAEARNTTTRRFVGRPYSFESFDTVIDRFGIILSSGKMWQASACFKQIFDSMALVFTSIKRVLQTSHVIPRNVVQPRNKRTLEPLQPSIILGQT